MSKSKSALLSICVSALLVSRHCRYPYMPLTSRRVYPLYVDIAQLGDEGRPFPHPVSQHATPDLEVVGSGMSAQSSELLGGSLF